MKVTDIAVEATTDGYLRVTEGDAQLVETQDRLIFSLQCRAVPLFSDERSRSEGEEALKLIAEAAPGDDIAGCLDACKSIASKALNKNPLTPSTPKVYLRGPREARTRHALGPDSQAAG